MRRGLDVLLAGLAFGLALGQAGCQSDARPWVPPQDHPVTLVSEAAFVRTGRGDFVDGYLADYESEFQKRRMFLVLEIARYPKGDRLVVTGQFTGDRVRLAFGGRPPEEVPVFEVERARPDVPQLPDIPAIK
jgi:hypothetical protein